MKKLFPIAFLFLFMLVSSSAANAQRQSYSTVNLKPGGIYLFTRTQANTKNHAITFNADSPVEVYLLDYQNLLLFQGGNSFSSYYSSGRVPNGGFNLRLSRGVYYLVVSNKFSVFTSKTVRLTFYD